MNTKLASIERIVNIESIDGSDNLEKATVLGWQCVVRKGEFKMLGDIGEFCVYIQVDSIVPNTNPIFAFMANRKYRVRTIKLRGCISQGLCLPVDYFKEELKDYYVDGIGWDLLTEGQDITTLLGITRYLSPSERNADYIGTPKKKHNLFIRYMTRFQWFRKFFHKKSKSFPEWISVTDEEKLNNYPWLLKDKLNTYYISEKYDGQSSTYWYKQKKLFGLFSKDEFGICSRTVRKFELDGSNWSRYAKENNLKERLKEVSKRFGNDICIQGELCGPGIR
jgi:hypothetical protein